MVSRDSGSYHRNTGAAFTSTARGGRQFWAFVAVLSLAQCFVVVGQDYGTVLFSTRIRFFRARSELRREFTEPATRKFARAVIRGRTERVREMIEQGVDVDMVGRQGLTPLYLALFGLNYDVFVTLIEAGADIHYQPENFGVFGGLTWDLFFIAASIGDGDYIAALLQRSRELGGVSAEFYREIVFNALRAGSATVGTMRAVLENTPPMSLIGSPYRHPAISAVTALKYEQARMLIDYDPLLFEDEELRSRFVARLAERSLFEKSFLERDALLQYLEATYRIEVQLQHPEPRLR